MIGRAAFLAALFAMPAMAQEADDETVPPVAYPSIAPTAQSPISFVPKGWKIVQSQTGDLNADGKADAAMVIRMDSPANRLAPSWSPDTIFDSNPWMLLVAFKSGAGFDLQLADHQLIPRHENPNADEEFDEIKIADGNLKVVMHLFMNAGGWEAGGSAFTFRWRDGGFKLIGFDRDEVHRGSGETAETSINYLTGRALLKKGNIGSDKADERWVDLPKRPLLDLAAIGDGLLFEPDVP